MFNIEQEDSFYLQRENDKFPKLTKVLEKINKLAEENNDIELKNIDHIFKNLSANEKMILVRGVVDILSISENLHKHLFENKLEKINKEREDIEIFNKKELIKLKSWLSKTIFIIFVPVFLVFMTFIYLLDVNKTTGLTIMIDDIFKILKVLFL